MKCIFCNKTINNYTTDFNHFEIDKIHSIDICADCISKFARWQQTKIAKLFPTKIMKKVFNK